MHAAKYPAAMCRTGGEDRGQKALKKLTSDNVISIESELHERVTFQSQYFPAPTYLASLLRNTDQLVLGSGETSHLI